MINNKNNKKKNHYQVAGQAKTQDRYLSAYQTLSDLKHGHPHAQVYKKVDVAAEHLKAAHQTRSVETDRRMGEKGTESGVAAMAACYQRFDPAAYLQYNYTPPRADFERKDSIVPWKLACLHRAFNEGEEMW